MQNRYVGDVGDFAKHGLLRFLSGMTSNDEESQLRLGLIWYMYHDERHGADPNKIGGDGKFIDYLKPTEKNDRGGYRDCDPDLWETLRRMVVEEDARCVHCVQRRKEILPDNTLFFDSLLNYPSYMPRLTRERMRELWLAGALQATEDADLVCVDPDNGIGDPTQMYVKRGPKFAYLSDLQTLWERKQSLVIYQHLGRDGDARTQVEKTTNQLQGGLPGAKPISLWFHRGTARVFYVIPHPESKHGETIQNRVCRFLERGWKKNEHFTRV